MVKKIISNLHELLSKSESKLRERIEELRLLSNLRGTYIKKLITKEIKKMPIVIDIREDLLYQEGIAKGTANGITKGLAKGLAKGLTKGIHLTAEKMLKM